MKKIDAWYSLTGEIVCRDIGIKNAFDKHPSRSNPSFWVLTILQSGQRTLLLDGEEIRIGPREFFLLPPDSVQSPLEYDNHTACFIHFWAKGIPADAPLHVDAAKLLLPVKGMLPPETDIYSYALALYRHFISPYADRGFLSLQLRALLFMISLECQKNPNREEHGTLAEQTLQFIQKKASASLRAQDYENCFHKSYHRINQVFMQQYGCTVKQYHQHIRMRHAAQMLSLGKTVQETAHDCGYEDSFYFSKSFAKEHGISPKFFVREQKFLTEKDR